MKSANSVWSRYKSVLLGGLSIMSAGNDHQVTAYWSIYDKGKALLNNIFIKTYYALEVPTVVCTNVSVYLPPASLGIRPLSKPCCRWPLCPGLFLVIIFGDLCEVMLVDILEPRWSDTVPPSETKVHISSGKYSPNVGLEPTIPITLAWHTY